jgi:hypothetical protein
VPLTLGALALPAQADAAFAGVSPDSNGLPTLFIHGGNSGENNRILSQLAEGRLQLFDSGLAQAPGTDCVRGPAESLICTGARQVNVNLAGGDDTLATTTSLPTLYLGGVGADVLFAGNGRAPARSPSAVAPDATASSTPGPTAVSASRRTAGTTTAASASIATTSRPTSKS